MKNLLSLLLALPLLLGGVAEAKKAAKSKKDGGGSHPKKALIENPASAEKIGELKGRFNWGMKPEDVMKIVKGDVTKKYMARREKAVADPGKQQRIMDEMNKELKAVDASYIKFDGKKSGLDVSIVGGEFVQNNDEAVLTTKEDKWTRYFFFFEGQLYKMFLAFNKDSLPAGVSFKDFGAMMQAKYGRAQELFRDEKTKSGAALVLDAYAWVSRSADSLKLVDRSQFYDVYCLVVYDPKIEARVMDKRKITNPPKDTSDSLVEAVATGSSGGRDENDNIMDRVTGREVKKVGEEEKGNIRVPSPSQGGPSAKEVNAKSGGDSAPKPEKSEKKSGKKGSFDLEL